MEDVLREAPEWMVSKETDWGYGLEAQSVGLAAALDVMKENQRGIEDKPFFLYSHNRAVCIPSLQSCLTLQP